MYYRSFFVCFNHSCHSLRMSYWNKRLLTCLLNEEIAFYCGAEIAKAGDWPGYHVCVDPRNHDIDIDSVMSLQTRCRLSSYG